MKSFAVLALLATTQAVTMYRGDAYPGVILPGSEPILPIPSKTIDLQLAEANMEGEHIRHHLQHKLRKAIRRGFPEEHNMVQL
jgi:hypothetical protein